MMIRTRSMTFLSGLGAAAFFSLLQPGHALTVEASGHEQSMASAQAVCSGRVTGIACFQEPGSDAIYTRATIEVIDVVKGELPSPFDLVYLGGTLGKVRMEDTGMPQLTVGDLRVFCLDAAKDGSFIPHAGCLGIWPVDSRAASGLLPADGLLVPNRRHVVADRGEPIGVVVDVSTRPAGISEAQALTALANALASWESLSYVTFEMKGTEVFTQSVQTINDRGRIIRVQMHDNWNHVSDTGTSLGVGGSYFSSVPATGGEFLGRSFREIVTSYVIVNHPKPALSDPVTLEATLAHEIGHTLGLAHSSETEEEGDPLLSEALMFYLIHDDGRGADPRSWDIDAIRRTFPTNNTPPYGFTHYLKVVSAPTGTLANPEVNIVNLVVDDLDGDAVSIDVVSDFAGNGTWSLNGRAVTFVPAGWFPDATAGDPLIDSYDRFSYRVYDGSFYSAVREVSVIAFRSDTRPSALPDGLPDSWMLDHFGSENPVAGTSTASDDVDNDRLTTLEEFLLGSIPTADSSGCTIDAISVNAGETSVEWGALPLPVYELQESLDGGATWAKLEYVQNTVPALTAQTNTVPVNPGTPTALYRIRTRH